MPFLFKLSKRVARIRCAILPVSAAALAAGESTGIASRLVISPKLITFSQNQVADVLGVMRRRNPEGHQPSTDWSKAAALSLF
jgi:hypothetical protein